MGKTKKIKNGQQGEKEFSQWLLALLFMLDLVLATGIVLGLKYAYTYTNHLLLYYCYVWFDYAISFVLALILMAVEATVSVRNGKLMLTEDGRGALRFGIGFILAIAAVIIVINGFFPVAGKYRVCEIDGKKPGKFQYMTAVLKDGIGGQTETVTFDAENVNAGRTTYSIRAGRGSREGHTDYISFHNDGVSFCTVQLRVAAVNYVRFAKKYKDAFTIEYYVNSGIVKAIDGIGVFDEDALDAARGSLEEQYEQRIAEEAALAEEIREEESRQWSVKFSTLMEGCGRQFDELVAEIEARDVVFDFPVHYISTQQFEVGSLAFYDNLDKEVYVVADQNGEDMVKVPALHNYMTLPEICKALDDAGIRYTYSTYSAEEKAEEKQTLFTCYCGPGTWIPKDFTYRFSVR